MPRIILYFLFILNTFAGSAGVKNGTISGMVVSSGTPLAGVAVVAVKNTGTELIRNASTDSNGIYIFNDVPVGGYTLGFQKYGYESITTEEGTTETQTAIGKQFRVYVESGSMVTAPKVTLRSLGKFGSGSIIINLIDKYTGETIDNATVSYGNNTAQQGASGQYHSNVNVAPSDDYHYPMIAIADGYYQSTEQLNAVPSEQVTYTVELEPQLSVIQGQVDLSQFPPSMAIANNIRISVGSIPSSLLSPVVDSDGFFQIEVPCSTASKVKSYNITIHVKGFYPTTVNSVVAPKSGASTIPYLIELTARTTPVRGQVVSAKGLNYQSSTMNMVFIKELGLSTSIQNGGYYHFPAVPVGIPFQITAHITGANGEPESGDMEFTATENGTGEFTLPTITTSP